MSERKFKRGEVVKAWGHLVGIIQNRSGERSYRITIDPVDPTQLYATPGARWWITVPEEALESLGR